MTEPQRLLVHKRALATLRAEPDPAATRPLAEGEARLQIQQYALTANNVTYAAFGDAMHYWAFFPSGDAAWGCVPVWGFAQVVESRCEGVAVGQRLYGFYPMASHLVVQPARVRPRGFVDGAAHRAALPPIYNEYIDCAGDPLHAAGQEGLQSLLRPLFTTAWLLADFLAEGGMRGAQRLLLSSASSKTAWATAFCARAGAAGGVARVGLSSAGNLGYVRELGVYDQALAYAELASLDASVPTLYVDFSGDAELRGAVHRHFGTALVMDCVVGGSHWQALKPQADPTLPGPRPQFFFAPDQARKRAATPPQGLGPLGLEQALAGGWAALLQAVAAGGWLQPRTVDGDAAIQDAFATLVAGRIGPRDGLVAVPG